MVARMRTCVFLERLYEKVGVSSHSLSAASVSWLRPQFTGLGMGQLWKDLAVKVRIAVYWIAMDAKASRRTAFQEHCMAGHLHGASSQVVLVSATQQRSHGFSKDCQGGPKYPEAEGTSKHSPNAHTSATTPWTPVMHWRAPFQKRGGSGRGRQAWRDTSNQDISLRDCFLPGWGGIQILSPSE